MISRHSEPKKPARVNISDKKKTAYDDMPSLTEDSDVSDDSDSECEEDHQHFVKKVNQILHCFNHCTVSHANVHSEATKITSKSSPCCCPCSERATCAITRCQCRKRGVHCSNCLPLRNGKCCNKETNTLPSNGEPVFQTKSSRDVDKSSSSMINQ